NQTPAGLANQDIPQHAGDRDISQHAAAAAAPADRMRIFVEGVDVDAEDEEQQEAEAARRRRRLSLGSAQNSSFSHKAPSGSMMERKTLSSWFIDTASLTTKNTFLDCESPWTEPVELPRRPSSDPGASNGTSADTDQTESSVGSRAVGARDSSGASEDEDAAPRQAAQGLEGDEDQGRPPQLLLRREPELGAGRPVAGPGRCRCQAGGSRR
ncbi:unnamed protein product, partial [Prorocentrum cordatum]